MNIPAWVKKSVFYQIFPDRFNKSNKLKLNLNFEDWDTIPTSDGFKGGNILGVIEKLDYLLDLGISAIYLNPVFASTANHRYHTYDYYNIDPILGTNNDFKKLIKVLHKNNIKIILDGVFNHASRGLYQFNHTLENGLKSPYIDWFYFNKEFIAKKGYVNAYSNDSSNLNAYDKYAYSAWYNLAALPKFNIQNKDVKQFILEVAKFWIDFGIDGWRLDVPNEIDDDDFWQDFRLIVKASNPNAYIVGEIWTEAKRWLKGDMFDAVMNYNLGKKILSYFINQNINHEAIKKSDYSKSLILNLNFNSFKNEILNTFNLYHSEIVNAQLNLLSSHDTARIISIASEKIELVKLCFAFLFFCPGAPCFFYGDEIGITGYDDPACRKSFNWNKNTWKMELFNFFKTLIKIRKENTVLHDGAIKFLYEKENSSIWCRENKNTCFIFAINNSSKVVNISTTYNNKDINFKLKAYDYDYIIFDNI